MFARVFLQTQKHVAKLDQAMLIMMGFAIMQILLSITGAISIAAKSGTIQAVITPFIIWLAGIRVWQAGYRPARFQVLACTLFIISIMFSGLTNAGLFPAVPFTVYALHYGSAAEVILLSLALADRMALLKQEKEALQTEHLLELEERVKERTTAFKKASEVAEEKAAQLMQANKELKELSTRDGLTGLLNHQTFFEQLKHAIDDARRYEYYLSVLLLDIDNFKKINDSFGHLTGNEVLQEVASIINQETRDSDIAGRFGGEEFVVVLSRATMTEALEKAEKIRNKIENLAVDGMDELTCTVSIGVTTLDWHLKEIDHNDVLKYADNAMYEAKQKGKNRIGVAEMEYKVVNGKR